MTRRLARRSSALLLPLALLIGAGSVSAFQPPSAGVQPLRERIVEINTELRRLNERLRAEETSAEDRAEAYRKSQELTAERAQLSQRVAEASDPSKQSPLINYAGPRAVTLTVPPELKESHEAQRKRALPPEPGASEPARLQVRGVTDL